MQSRGCKVGGAKSRVQSRGGKVGGAKSRVQSRRCKVEGAIVLFRIKRTYVNIFLLKNKRGDERLLRMMIYFCLVLKACFKIKCFQFSKFLRVLITFETGNRRFAACNCLAGYACLIFGSTLSTACGTTSDCSYFSGGEKAHKMHLESERLRFVVRSLRTTDWKI